MSDAYYVIDTDYITSAIIAHCEEFEVFGRTMHRGTCLHTFIITCRHTMYALRQSPVTAVYPWSLLC